MAEQTCMYPEECCRELSRVWTALAIENYNGKSASENVAALTASLSALREQVERQRDVIRRLRQHEAWANFCDYWDGCGCDTSMLLHEADLLLDPPVGEHQEPEQDTRVDEARRAAGTTGSIAASDRESAPPSVQKEP